MKLSSRGAGLLLISPALAVIAFFFLLPLALSVHSALTTAGGSFTLAHFEKSFDLYTNDMLFTVAIVLPEGSCRLQDFLNSAARFFEVRDGRAVHFVNRDRVVMVRAME